MKAVSPHAYPAVLDHPLRLGRRRLDDVAERTLRRVAERAGAVAVVVRMAVTPYLVSRAGLFLAAWAAAAVFGTARVHDPRWPAPLQLWLSWDAVHYLHLAAAGYPAAARAVDTGYFPLLPALIHLAGGSAAAALALAFGLGLAAVVALVALTRELLGPRAARRVAWIACWWPEAFVLSAVYTEAPFLLAAVGALWASWRGRAPAAALLGAAAALLRPNGFLIALPMLVLLPSARARLAAAAPPLATAAFAAFLWLRTGTPLAFAISQRANHPLHPGVFSVLRLTRQRPDDLLGLAALVIAALLALRLLRMRELGRWRTASVLLVAALLLPPLLSGTLASYGRYALAAFPLFWAATGLRLGRLAPYAVPAAAVVAIGCTAGRLTP